MEYHSGLDSGIIQWDNNEIIMGGYRDNHQLAKNPLVDQDSEETLWASTGTDPIPAGSNFYVSSKRCVLV